MQDRQLIDGGGGRGDPISCHLLRIVTTQMPPNPSPLQP